MGKLTKALMRTTRPFRERLARAISPELSTEADFASEPYREGVWMPAEEAARWIDFAAGRQALSEGEQR